MEWGNNSQPRIFNIIIYNLWNNRNGSHNMFNIFYTAVYMCVAVVILAIGHWKSSLNVFFFFLFFCDVGLGSHSSRFHHRASRWSACVLGAFGAGTSSLFIRTIDFQESKRSRAAESRPSRLAIIHHIYIYNQRQQTSISFSTRYFISFNGTLLIMKINFHSSFLPCC